MVDEPNTKAPEKTWWIHIDMTTVVVLVALAIVAFSVKAYFSKLHNDEVVAVERARVERVLKEEETARKEEAARLEKRLEREKENAERAQRNAEEDARNKAVIEERTKAKEAALKKANEAFEAARKREEENGAAQTNAIIEAQNAAQAAAKEAALAAEKKKKEEDAAYREQSLSTLKQTISKADAEIDDANKQAEPMRMKMIAFKNHMETAMKQNETLRKNIGSLQNAQGSRATAGGTSVGFDLSEEMIKQAGKQDSVNKDFRDAANGYSQLAAERKRLETVVAEAKVRKETALAALKTMGVVPDAPVKPVVAAVEKPATLDVPAAPKSTNKIYIMKDGKKYLAVKSIEAGDTISIKLENGKFEALNKDDIEKVVNE